MRAAQKSESPAATGLFAELTSIYLRQKSTASRTVPKVPAFAEWDGAAGWHLTAHAWPGCGGQHHFDGGRDLQPAYGAHDALCGVGVILLCRVDVSALACMLRTSEAAILDAVHQLPSVADLDRRLKLRPGTAVAAMLDAMEVPE
jgi:hypothetical protein